MKNDMALIMEGWRKSNLLEGVADLIQNKSLDAEAIEKIGEELSKNPSFELAVELFSALSQADTEDLGVEEGVMDWINAKVVQGMIAKDNLADLLRSDSRFAPLLKMSGPALALAFLYFKNEAGGVDPDDYASALDIIAKKGSVSLEGLADATLSEKLKRSPNG